MGARNSQRASRPALSIHRLTHISFSLPLRRDRVGAESKAPRAKLALVRSHPAPCLRTLGGYTFPPHIRDLTLCGGNDETCKVNFYSIQTHRFLSPRPLSTPPSSIRSSVMIQPPWISRDRGSWADAPSSHALSPVLPSWPLLATTLSLFSTAEPSSQRKLEPARLPLCSLCFTVQISFPF